MAQHPPSPDTTPYGVELAERVAGRLAAGFCVSDHHRDYVAQSDHSLACFEKNPWFHQNSTITRARLRKCLGCA